MQETTHTHTHKSHTLKCSRSPLKFFLTLTCTFLLTQYSDAAQCKLYINSAANREGCMQKWCKHRLHLFAAIIRKLKHMLLSQIRTASLTQLTCLEAYVEKWCLRKEYTGLLHWHVTWGTCCSHRPEQVSSTSHLTIPFLRRVVWCYTPMKDFTRNRNVFNYHSFMSWTQLCLSSTVHVHTHIKKASPALTIWACSLSHFC
jgi:hypothetical protein